MFGVQLYSTAGAIANASAVGASSRTEPDAPTESAPVSVPGPRRGDSYRVLW